jgi:polysaccharide export outer membrane protein
MKQTRFLIASLLLPLCLQACSSADRHSAPAVPTAADSLAQPIASPSSSRGSDYVPAVIGIPADPAPISAYRIGPQDLLKIDVFQVAEFSTQERVDAAGMITMPEIGDVQVGGFTPKAAEQRIAARLGERVLQNPQVSVFVLESASQRVTVTGHVKRPGIFPLTAETTLMQAIALAGGLDDVAKKQEIIVFRKQQGGDMSAYVVDLAAIEQGKLSDPRVVADDRIVVPKSGAAVLSRNVNNVLTGWALRVPFM